MLAEFDIDSEHQAAVSDAFARLLRASQSMVARSNEDVNLPGAVSSDFLDLMGMTLCAWAWGVMSCKAGDDDFGMAKKQTARFFFARLLPKTLGLEQSISANSDVLMDMPDALFNG